MRSLELSPPLRGSRADNRWPRECVAGRYIGISVLCLLGGAIGACRGSTSTSLLAGNWVLPDASPDPRQVNSGSASAADPGVASMTFFSPRTSSETERSGRRFKSVRIRPDGSFDWSGTFFERLLPINSLRNVGDSASVRMQPDVECVVLWSRYTAESSELALMQRSTSGNGEIPVAIAYHTAVLRGPDRLDYNVVEIQGNDEAGAARYELVRSESDPVATEPFGTVELVSAARAAMHTESGELPGGRRFRILLPNGGVRQRTLIVALHSSFHSDYERTWVPLVHTLGCAVLMPELRFESGPPSPSRPSAEREVAVIRKCLEQARGRLRPSRVILYAEYDETLLGHLIWQQDNRDFDAFVATSSSFLEWNDVVGDDVDRAKPLYFAVNELEWGSVDHIVSWYEHERGYENVKKLPGNEMVLPESTLVQNRLIAVTDDLNTDP